MTSSIDLLAIGAHPDDCELFAGGLLGSCASKGHAIALCDLTRGEAATRGTPEERQQSAQSAAAILSIATRINLDLGDAGLENTPAARTALVRVLRQLRPRAVLTHDPADRHPDHTRAHEMVRECCFYATVGGFDKESARLEKEPFLFFFYGNAPVGEFRPDFIFPLSEEDYARREAALACYASQFHRANGPADSNLPPTLISSAEYARAMQARYAWFGSAVGARYGEPYRFHRPPAVVDLLGLLNSF